MTAPPNLNASNLASVANSSSRRGVRIVESALGAVRIVPPLPLHQQLLYAGGSNGPTWLPALRFPLSRMVVADCWDELQSQ